MKTKLFALALTMICGCGQSEYSMFSPKVLKLGATENLRSGCLHSQHRCGPERDEIRQQFRAIFASESVCQGVHLQELTEQEEHIPIKDIPGYLGIQYAQSNRWSFELNSGSNWLAGDAKDEREIAEKVCRILKGAGGTI